jgi:hypothetical protein
MIDFDIEDIYFVCRDMCDWKSVISKQKAPTMQLLVYCLSRNINGKNLALVSKVEAKMVNQRRSEFLKSQTQNLLADGPRAGGILGLCLTGENSSESDQKIYAQLSKFIKHSEKCYPNAFPIFTNLAKNISSKNQKKPPKKPKTKIEN